MKPLTREEIVEALLSQMLRETKHGPPPEASMVDVAKRMLRPLARDIVGSGLPFLVMDSGKAIMCFTCGLVSHHPKDVEHRYCGNCHVFHES